jgi:endonuclease YncB( thermonuclease family)
VNLSRALRALLVIAACVALAYAATTYFDRRDEQAAPAPRATNTPLLQVTSLKDGDSWDASDGREYRLGLVNAPEPSEPCFAEATQFTRRFLANGFTANAYSMDSHGRHIAEVFDRAGSSLNVALARSGLANGKYLENFRRENPDLARRVERALNTAATPACR